MAKLRDLTGQQFGSWTVIERGPNTRSNDTRWLCRCSCGTTKLVRAALLTERRSYRCKQCYWTTLQGAGHPRWSGYGEIQGWYWHKLEKDAAKRGIRFDLSIEDAWELFLHQVGCCALSGLELSFGKNNGEQTASLDRIDSDQDYVIDNVQWVHKLCNMMKLRFSQEDYIKMCCQVADYQRELQNRYQELSNGRTSSRSSN